MTGPLLRVDDLSVSFGTPSEPIEVVRGVSFEIEVGATLGVVGESGSGKSMTSLAIMGLLPRGARVSGSVRFDGEELLGRSDGWMRARRGDRMGMVFQDPLSSLHPFYSVGSQIAEAYRAHRRVSASAAKRVAIAAMERVQIRDAAGRYDHYPHQFSGGMRQRIVIAMALVCEPELLIADEPTTALDVTVQAQILELLASVQEETGIGMLFITHDLAVISEIADHVLVMQDGAAVERGSAEQIFSDPRHPYTNRLLDATPRVDGEVPR